MSDDTNRFIDDSGCGSSNIYSNFSLVILAGGKSRRMGLDKAGLLLGGKTFLENVISKGTNAGFGEIIVSGAGEHPNTAINVADEFVDSGPLGGIHACLKRASRQHCFVVGVDMPKINFTRLTALAEFHVASGRRVTVVRKDGMLEPLVGVYDRVLHEYISEDLKNGQLKVARLIKRAPYNLYDFDDCDGMLDNINTLEDYKHLIEQGETH